MSESKTRCCARNVNGERCKADYANIYHVHGYSLCYPHKKKYLMGETSIYDECRFLTYDEGYPNFAKTVDKETRLKIYKICMLKLVKNDLKDVMDLFEKLSSDSQKLSNIVALAKK